MNQGKETFTERLAKKEATTAAAPVSLGVYGRGVNDLLFINQLKHMDKGEEGLIDLDVEECALAALSKALVSYVALAGDQNDIVLAFKAWAWQNLDPKKYGAEGSPHGDEA